MAHNYFKNGTQLPPSSATTIIPRQKKNDMGLAHDFNYAEMAIYLSEKYRKEEMCEAHNSIFVGHNATQKTYPKISTSYY